MRNTKGITLPEILIGMTVAAVAGTLLINLLVSSNILFFNESVKVRQGLSLNQAAKEITASIKSSFAVVNQYPPTGAAQFTTGPEALVLKIPSIDQNGSVIDQKFDYIVFYKDPSSPKILRKQIFKDASSYRKEENKVLATSLDQLKFIYLDATNTQVAPVEAVRINFSINLDENTATSDNESSGSGTVNLKN